MSFDFLGLGGEISPDMIIDEQLQASGLDWQVLTSPMIADIGGGKYIKYHNSTILMRSDTLELLTIAGKGWQPYSNRHFLGDFNKFCNTAGYLVERAGFIYQPSGRNTDAIAFASATIPGSKNGKFSLKGDDESAMRVIFLNPFSYGKGIGIFAMNERLFCENQLTLKGKRVKRSLKHAATNLHGKEGICKVEQTLKSLETMISNYWHISTILANTKISDREAVDFLINHFGDKNKEIHKQPQAARIMMEIFFNERSIDKEGVDLAMDTQSCQHTAYGLLNAVTAYDSHFHGYDPQTGRATIANSQRLLNTFDSLSTKAYTALSRQYVANRDRRILTQPVRAF